jgi:DNA modification methylase
MARTPQPTKQTPPKHDQLPLRLEWLAAETLSDNPSNWRRHPGKQLTALKDVLAEVGWAGALLYNERSKRLIDGHARKKVSSGKVPVLVGSWSEEQERKILATLDPLAAMAEADTGVLAALLKQVETESDAVRELLANLAAGELVPLSVPEETLGLTDPDEVPEPPDEPTTKPGDLWVLGEHRLLCGDSSKPEDVDRLLDGAQIHLVNMDPPYNVKVEPRSNNAIAAGNSSFAGPKHHQKLDLARHPEKAKPTQKKLRAKDRPLANDFVTDEEFDRLLYAWFGNMARVLVPGGAFYIWGGYANLGNYPPVLKECGLYFSQGIVWNKLHPVLTRKDYMGCFELAFYGWREGAGHKFYGPNNALDLWDVKKVNPQSMIHLTEKPVELASRAIQYSSRPGDNVLDLFGGSGSTLIAAQQTGRRAYLMELDPLYCDIIVERWERFTGKKAELAGSRPQST